MTLRTIPFDSFPQDPFARITRTPFDAVLPSRVTLYLRLRETRVLRSDDGKIGLVDRESGVVVPSRVVQTTDVSDTTRSLILGPSASPPPALVEELQRHSPVLRRRPRVGSSKSENQQPKCGDCLLYRSVSHYRLFWRHLLVLRTPYDVECIVGGSCTLGSRWVKPVSSGV